MVVSAFNTFASWFALYLSFIGDLWTSFPFYIEIMLSLIGIYIVMSRLLLPVIGGNLPLGQGRDEIEAYKFRKQYYSQLNKGNSTALTRR